MLTTKQMNFVKAKVQGFNNKDSAIKAGYKAINADVVGSQLMKNAKIAKALEKRGLSDDKLADYLGKAIDKGMDSDKASLGDSIRAIDLVTRLKGYQDKTQDNSTTNNVYINQLLQLNDIELTAKVEELTSEIKELSE